MCLIDKRLKFIGKKKKPVLFCLKTLTVIFQFKEIDFLSLIQLGET